VNKVILAPAGGRKTQTIVDLCKMGDDKKRLIVTFTTTGQKVIQERLWKHDCYTSNIEVSGWYAFLLNHFIYPYVYDKYPMQSVNGLHFVEGRDPTRYKSGSKRYFDSLGKVYSNNIGKLAFDIAQASEGACIERLQGIYHEIYFDEVQDLGGNDLEILQMLMESGIKIIAVGDVRQSTLKTSRTDRKNSDYNGLDKILWFRKMETKGICKIEERDVTWRCNQEIIDFADSVLPKKFEFPPTRSTQNKVTGHDGVFVVSWENVRRYIDCFSPTCYRHSVSTNTVDGGKATNFGLCKGETVSRGLIYPTGPIKSFLIDPKKQLTNKSASLFYVAITRAKYSVAIVVEEPQKYNIKEWSLQGIAEK